MGLYSLCLFLCFQYAGGGVPARLAFYVDFYVDYR